MPYAHVAALLMNVLLFGADTSTALPAAGVASRRPPQWIPQCIAILKKARDRYAQKDPRFAKLAITTDIGRQESPPGSCSDRLVDAVDFALPQPRTPTGGSIYSGSVRARSGTDDDPPEAWTRVGPPSGHYYWRHDAGRDASTNVDASDAPGATAFTVAFQAALDQCIALAPAASLSYVPSPAEVAALCQADAPQAPFERCAAAELAANELEKMCEIEGKAIGDGGGPGRTLPAVMKITALNADAIPILRRLARSKNPTARAAAAIALGELHGDAARAELRRLATDDQWVTSQEGCTGGAVKISTLAQRALAPLKVP